MKRIDRIILSALGNTNKKEEFSQRIKIIPKTKVTLNAKQNAHHITNTIDDVDLAPATLSPVIAPGIAQHEDDVDLAPATLSPVIAPGIAQHEDDVDLAPATLSPMIAPGIAQHEDDVDLAPATLSPVIAPGIAQHEDDVDLAPATLSPSILSPEMDQLKNDVISPAAPLYSPLTPLVAASRTAKLQDDLISPAAPLYSPLTPLVAASKTTKLQESEKSLSPSPPSSPLPPMSPKTFELFETLSKKFPLENTKEFADFNMSKEETLNTKEFEDIRNKENIENYQVTDYSCDTDSDYVPDSEEDSDNTHARSTKRKVISNAKDQVFKNISDSEDSSNDETPRPLSQPHDAMLQSVENQESVLETSNSTTKHTHLVDSVDQNSETQSISQTGRPKKGRKRKYPDHTLAQKKARKYNNLPYNIKNKRIESKVYKNYACTCTRLCFIKVTQEQRRKEFEQYMELGTYEAQLLFITNNVKETPKARSYTVTNNKTGKNKPRTYRRSYFISDVEVCKSMFLHNFQISSKKIDVSLQKRRSNQSLKDQRGIKQGGWNKTPEEDVEFIKKVISSLPKYESHYRRENNSDCQYLKLGMTIQKIYEFYLEETKTLHGKSKKPVSLETLKRIFYKHFNLRCKSLKKDTCNRCDTFTEKIKNCSSDDEKSNLQKEKEDHLKRAQDLRQQMNDDLSRAKTDNMFECLTFDLEKTLPLPRIPTNIVFYKRQLWLYNSGIHAGSNDTGHCNVWLEGEAGRGAQEVGSCLVRYIKNYVDPDVEELALWSDCCGGQNRNIKIVLMLKAMLHSHPTLKTITLKFLESGHTFLPNDTDFSKIEYQLRYHERIYTAEDYINVMKSCKKKNPLQVYRMQNTDFLSTSKIEKKIINRKIFVTKERVNWLKTKAISIKKNCKHSIFMQTDGIVRELNIEKKLRGKVLDISEDDFVFLWPDGKEIAQAKLDDLKSMFSLIPKDCLEFYKSLRGKQISEDVDGFGVELDFDVEQELNDEN